MFTFKRAVLLPIALGMVPSGFVHSDTKLAVPPHTHTGVFASFCQVNNRPEDACVQLTSGVRLYFTTNTTAQSQEANTHMRVHIATNLRGIHHVMATTPKSTYRWTIDGNRSVSQWSRGNFEQTPRQD